MTAPDIKCAECKYAVVDESASMSINGKWWTAYMCSNRESDYFRAILNTTPNGATVRGITWRGCKHGKRRMDIPLEEATDEEARQADKRAAVDTSSPSRGGARQSRIIKNGLYQCCTCKKMKPAADYYASRTRRDGVVSSCKDCQRSYSIAYNKRRKGAAKP